MIDHDRIVAMAQHDCPVVVIAHRLRVSIKTVRRVLKASGVQAQSRSYVGTQDEWRFWALMHEQGHSLSHIAYCYGFSRQYISEFFNRKAEAA
jgi:hypothetical protein